MTSVRLAYNPGPINTYHALAPSVRLALVEAGPMTPTNLARALTNAPALLVSYFYLEPFLKHQARYVYRDWALDSGAFSAHNSGATIDLAAYIDTCHRLLATDPTLTEVFTLDVIGDWRASLKNAEAMWKAGLAAIPCYHHGEPVEALIEVARSADKIALGGAVGLKGDYKIKWAAQCFARVWPKKIHGFGYGAEKQVMALPWHSVDATNWELGPCKFGRWNAHGQMSVRGSSQNLRSEVEFFLRLEQKARVKWAAQMKQLNGGGPTIRLAEIPNGRVGKKTVTGWAAGDKHE
jgi:hypothetical protein